MSYHDFLAASATFPAFPEDKGGCDNLRVVFQWCFPVGVPEAIAALVHPRNLAPVAAMIHTMHGEGI
jgi:hypothetical protein